MWDGRGEWTTITMDHDAAGDAHVPRMAFTLIALLEKGVSSDINE